MPRSVPVSIEAKVPAMITPQLVMMPPVCDHGHAQPLQQPAPPLLLEHPRDQVDVVVLAHRHQDHEQEDAAASSPGPSNVSPYSQAKNSLGDAQGHEVAEEHREDQVQRNQRAAEQRTTSTPSTAIDTSAPMRK